MLGLKNLPSRAGNATEKDPKDSAAAGPEPIRPHLPARSPSGITARQALRALAADQPTSALASTGAICAARSCRSEVD
jgi:hypothetical protein